MKTVREQAEEYRIYVESIIDNVCTRICLWLKNDWGKFHPKYFYYVVEFYIKSDVYELQYC